MYRFNVDDDVLIYLRGQHTGSENAVPSAKIECLFGISGVAVRQIVNKLRCEGQPVCSDANGYFYAKSKDEINGTISQLLGRTAKINAAARGLVLSQRAFSNERAVIAGDS